MHLDGNAAAGLLGEVFTAETTTAMVTCAHCGASGALGTATVYVSDIGTVVRCSRCAEVLLRCAEIRDRVVLDMRGVASMRVQVPG